MLSTPHTLFNPNEQKHDNLQVDVDDDDDDGDEDNDDDEDDDVPTIIGITAFR